MTIRIACVGGAVLDLIYGVDRLPGEDGKTHALSYLESGGGMAANAAVTVARLGGEASWWGRVGDDDKGARVLDGLRAEGIDVSRARIVAGAISSHSVVLGDRAGNRAIVLYRSAALDPDAGFLPLGEIAALDAVVADNRWIEGAVAALGEARRLGRFAVLDADAGTGPRSIEAVRMASHAIFSEPGLAEIYGATDPAEGLGRALEDCPFVAVTLGARGALWCSADGASGVVPAFPVEALETVGAGDVFHGAFAFALAGGEGEAAALRFAAAAAALKCARTGGRSSFPSRSAVDGLVRHGGPVSTIDQGERHDH
ncbi:MAG TPA: PfkB family carbohydrate kinase [Kaistia sp.]|nr:PfkB family carbohydrate kinase [Kaistia sp.]